MLPTTRAQAIKLGASQYHTGQPCRNGHLAPRYTQSGTCRVCLLESGRRHVTEKAARQAGEQLPELVLRQQRVALLPALVEIKLRVHIEDGPVFLAAVADLTRARHPCLMVFDVIGSGRPISRTAGTGVYRVACDVADMATLQQVAAGFMAAKRPQLPSVAQRLVEGGTSADLEGAAAIAASGIL